MTSRPSPPTSGSPLDGDRTEPPAEDRSETRLPILLALIGLGVGIGFLVLWVGTARAHGGSEHSGVSTSLLVVLWVPVLTGFLGGIVGVRYRAWSLNDLPRHRLLPAVWFLLLVLGATFAASALTIDPSLGIGGISVGVLVTGWIASRFGARSWYHGHQGEFTLGGICVHRLLEGVTIGAVYTISPTIGVGGMVIVAGHAALETGTVGAVFSARWVRGVAAVCLVQIGYLVGAVIGIGGGVSIPTSVHVVTSGLLAGAFLMVCVAELRHATTGVSHRGVPE